MRTPNEKILRLASFIMCNGELTNKAKSCWGADVYKLGLLSATIEDDGYTHCVYSENLGLTVADTCGTIVCRRGKIADLDVLYDTIFESE